MMDKEQRAHDLAMQVVSELLSRDFDTLNDGNEKDKGKSRINFALSVLDEYNYFYETFKNSMK